MQLNDTCAEIGLSIPSRELLLATLPMCMHIIFLFFFFSLLADHWSETNRHDQSAGLTLA